MPVSRELLQGGRALPSPAQLSGEVTRDALVGKVFCMNSAAMRFIPVDKLEEETLKWAREMLANSPTALRFLKAALNADCDGQAGLQELAGSATLLYYLTEEGREGKEAFLEKRKPNFRKFKRFP